MKFVATLMLIFLRLPSPAQSYSHIQESSSNPFLTDVNGHPLYTSTNYIAEGSPYFIDGYFKAQLVAANGAIYRDVRIKINILDRIVQYLTADGMEMIADIPVKRVLFLNDSTGNDKLQNIVLEGFPIGINTPGSSVCEVVVPGSTRFLKKISISSRDTKNYNDATITRVFERKETYYSQIANGELKKLEKGRQAILDLFSSKRDAMALFIDQHHLGCKSETDYIAIFSFYNSLR